MTSLLVIITPLPRLLRPDYKTGIANPLGAGE